MTDWLILTDYASKHKVSVSTLRRRIKADQIRFKFEDGKYLLQDDEVENGNSKASQESLSSYHQSQPVQAPSVEISARPLLAAEGKLKELREGAEEPILSTATRLLNELKRAYSSILQEKEEQMIQLKEEVSDLKTLVRVLESDNDRMRGILQKWGNS